jgi:hypothetical protein
MSNVAASYARRALAGVAIAASLGAAHAVAQTPSAAPATLVNAPIAAAPAAASMPPAVAAAPAATASPAASAPVAASTPAEGDIRDIRGPKPVYSVWAMALLLAGGVLVAIGAYAAWRWNRRRKLRAVKLPFEIALQRIEDARALMLPNNGRAFSIEVSDAVREYIERRFQVMAAHRTTHEFLHDLLGSADALLAGHRTSLAGFLNLCDLAKFGGWNLFMKDMETMQRSARAFVLETGRDRETAKSGAAPRPSAGMEIYDSLSST